MSESRLQREIEHHREIAEQAEVIWNWDSPSGRRRADRRARIFVERGGLSPGGSRWSWAAAPASSWRRWRAPGPGSWGSTSRRTFSRGPVARLAGTPNVALHRGNAEQMPYAASSFDAVYGSSVLHHLDLDRALAEVFRVLRPGGRCVFTEPNILNPQVAVMFHLGLTKRYFGVSPDEMAFSRFRAARALKAAGFAGAVVEPFDFLHPATPEALCDVRRPRRAGDRARAAPARDHRLVRGEGAPALRAE